MRATPTAHTRTRFPRNVEELIAELERRYPEPTVRPGQSRDEIMHAAGERAVVVRLAQELAQARKKDLSDDVSR